MATRSDPTGPSLPTIKRLFAHSGDRCAFPRCAEALFVGGTVVGEICHIKGARPGAPRYDDQQTAADRHGYDNLILLCSKHHTVIDGDEEAYAVEHLVRMKTEHEQKAAPLDDAFAERAAQLFIKLRVHERQVDPLTSLGHDFRKAMECLQSMTRRFKFENEITIEEYSSLCEGAITSARKTFSNARLLFPLALAEQCEKFFNCMFKGQSYLASALHPGPVDGHQRGGFWDKAAKIAHEELPSILAEIERTARNLIHSEPPSS